MIDNEVNMFSKMNIKHIRWYHRLFLWVLPRRTIVNGRDQWSYKKLFGKVYIIRLSTVKEKK